MLENNIADFKILLTVDSIFIHLSHNRKLE